MKTVKILASAAVIGVTLAGLSTAPAFAWHPEGKIKKYVQNVTQNGQQSDANTAETAVSAKPGDTLKYIITVSNVGKPHSGGHNDMANTVVTDTLPAGVVMADGSSSQFTVNLGLIKPGEQKTKELLVKVTSDQNGKVIENKACFTGNSTVNDAPQAGCDVANIKVNVPPTPQPEPEPKPEQPKTEPKIESAATVLPSTGPASLLVPAGIAGGLGYFGNLLRLKRKQQR